MSNLTNFDDLNILARTAFGENRSGGEPGMQSVLNVIMNRSAKAKWWGDTPRSVCLKPYQFSCWMPDDPNYELLTTVGEDNAAFALALKLAAEALSGTLADLTSGATYYISAFMTKWPHWAVGHKPCAEIEHQIFFNDIE